MNKDDPFSNYLDEDKTVLKPSPRRRNQQTAPQPQQPQENADTQFPVSGGTKQLNLYSDNNVLVGCALPLLSLISQLRNSASHDDIPGLRTAVINEVKTFDTKARQMGCPAEQVQTARYIICSLLDEVVLNTPWGCNSVWSTQGMLITFHKESWGGEKFFQVLNNIIAQPGTYLNLLELFYYCLSLGFEGKYKVQELGQNSLFDVRENLYQVIERQKGDYEQDLAIHWRGITDKRNALARYIPLWVVAAVVAAILTLVFIGFFYLVSQDSGPEIGQQYQIKDALNIKPEVIKPMPPAQPEIIPEIPVVPIIEQVREFLAPEIQQNKVEVVDKGDFAIIRILAKNFFASGSDKIQSKYYPLMKSISEALEVVHGQITVVGHTDNIPIFTVKFPSNWVLSQARAEAVAKILSGNEHHKDKIIAEGRADTQRLVPNNSAKNRALNRRVEINF